MIQPTLSFYIAYNNAIFDVKKTLKQSLSENYVYKGYIEFIIVDFSKETDLDCWLSKNCNDELSSGYLKYFREAALDSWHESIAKNRAATYTSKDVIVNVDCGFIVDFESTTRILKVFINSKNTVVHIKILQEYLGHIAVPRDFFAFVGGYDESLEPTGFQTIDLFNRLSILGLHLVSYKQNEVYYSSFKSIHFTCGYTNRDYNRMLNNNFIHSKKNLSQGILIANGCYEDFKEDSLTHKDALNYLDKLIEPLSANIFLSEKIGLSDGQAGIVNLLYRYSRYKGDSIIESIAEKLLDSVVDRILKKTEREIAEVALSIYHLIDEKFVEPDMSIFEEIDSWLFSDKKEKIDFEYNMSFGVHFKLSQKLILTFSNLK